MEKIMATLWTIVLCANIVSAAVGNDPNWMLVFCPLVCLVIDKWKHVE